MRYPVFAAVCCIVLVWSGASPVRAQTPGPTAYSPSLYGVYLARTGYDVALPDTQRTRPPLKPGLLLGQYAGGLVGGALFGVVFGYGGFVLAAEDVLRCNEGPYCEFGFVFIAFAAGITAGSAIGVQAIGSTKEQRAPFVAALSGSALGTLLAFAAFSNDDGLNDGEVLLLLSLPTVGAVFTFNAARRYRDGGAAINAALVNLKRGTWSVGLPPITRQPDPLTLGQTQAYQMRLLRVRF